MFWQTWRGGPGGVTELDRVMSLLVLPAGDLKVSSEHRRHRAQSSPAKSPQTVLSEAPQAAPFRRCIRKRMRV
jgi:hypothetical protein